MKSGNQKFSNLGYLERMMAPDSAAMSERSITSDSVDAGTSLPSLPGSQSNRSSATFSARNGKRLSLSFPVQPIDIATSSRGTPTTSEPPSALLSSGPVSTNTQVLGGEPADFMVVLAAQERRVLELKEELDRAEVELVKLKKQWAHHEAYRKRAEVRNTEQKLRPVRTGKQLAELQADEDPEDLVIRRNVELDKRKALLIGLSKDSRRTVISGGHTRALSLLSPDRSNFHSSSFQALNGLQPADSLTSESRRGISLDGNIGGPRRNLDPRLRHSYQETGQYQNAASGGLKDIAEDLKAGLWTFMEDLRQATIGQEALESPPKKISKKPSDSRLISATSSRHSSTARGKSATRHRPAPLKSITPPLDTEENDKMLVDVHTPTSGKRKTDSGLGLDDDWGNWDSPISIKSLELSEDQSDLSGSSTKTTRLPLSPNEGIPWPALDGLSPDNLKRTASAIMKEWERSLTPSPQEGHDPMNLTEDASLQEQEVRLLLSNLP